MEKVVRIKSTIDVWLTYINICKRHGQPCGPIYKRATIYIKEIGGKNKIADEWLNSERDATERQKIRYFLSQ